jgi:hypothetical protein
MNLNAQQAWAWGKVKETIQAQTKHPVDDEVTRKFVAVLVADQLNEFGETLVEAIASGTVPDVTTVEKAACWLSDEMEAELDNLLPEERHILSDAEVYGQSYDELMTAFNARMEKERKDDRAMLKEDAANLLEHLWDHDEGMARIVERLFELAFPNEPKPGE